MSTLALDPDAGRVPGSPVVPVTPLPASALPLARGWFARLFSLRIRLRPRPRTLRFRCGEGLLFGDSPTLADLQDLARDERLRSVVNLNTEGESEERLSPNVEASWAHALALHHERASFTADQPCGADVERFLHALAHAPRPVLVHSRHGRRAAAMVLIHLGLERGLTGRGAVAAARDLGFACEHEALRRFAEAELDRRVEHGVGSGRA